MTTCSPGSTRSSGPTSVPRPEIFLGTAVPAVVEYGSRKGEARGARDELPAVRGDRSGRGRLLRPAGAGRRADLPGLGRRELRPWRLRHAGRLLHVHRGAQRRRGQRLPVHPRLPLPRRVVADRPRDPRRRRDVGARGVPVPATRPAPAALTRRRSSGSSAPWRHWPSSSRSS